MDAHRAKQHALFLNRALRGWFENRRLDLEAVWRPLTDDLEQQNHQLKNLQSWVIAYELQHDRDELEDRGFSFPPIDPCIDSDVDWYRFERWMRREPLSWTYSELFGDPPESSSLTETQIRHELDRIMTNLESRGVTVALQRGVPQALKYEYLDGFLEDSFDDFGPQGLFVIDGCSGFCPECFQREWCAAADEFGWSETGESHEVDDVVGLLQAS